MKSDDVSIRRALNADSPALPAFDEALHARVAADIGRAARSFTAGGSSIESRSWTIPLAWLLGPAALAACVVMAVIATRRTESPDDDLATSVAAITCAARAPLAFSSLEMASLPIQPVRKNLAAFQDDSRRLARFVGDQLNILPGPG